MRVAAAVVILAILAPALNLFLTMTALPTILDEIGGLALYAWTVIAYSVTSIVGSAASSAVARRLALRQALLVAGAVFAGGSAVCGAAPSMLVVVLGRAVQGLGGGMITGVVHAMIREVFPAHMWSRMLATISVAWGVSALTGPFIGGLLAERGLWRVAFWAMVPFVAIVVALAWRLLPARPRTSRTHGAPFGRLLLLCAAVLALAFVGNTGSVVLRALLLLTMTAAIAAALGLDARAPARLFPSGMLSLRRPIGQCFWTIFLIVMAVSPVGIYMSLLLQRVHGASPALAGYVFAGHSLAWTAMAIVTARVPSHRVRIAIVAGPFIVAAGLAALFLTIGEGPLAAVALGIALEGMGIGTCWAHIGSVVFASARPDEEEATAALVPSTQLFAISFGSAVSGVIASAVGLTRDASPAVAAATGEALFGAFAALAVVAGVIASRLVPSAAPRR
jgi:MFS family permease